MDNAGAAWELPHRLRSVLSAFVVMFALLVAAIARADGEPSRATLDETALGDGDRAAEALFQLGQLDERDLEFAQAIAHYRASYAKSPSSRYATRATYRADALKAHSEGDFAPLVRLERVRRDPALANDSDAIDSLARDADQFPPGLVRIETWMLVGEAYAGRLHRHTEAIAFLRRVVADPKTDPLTARQAARQIVETQADDGDLDGAAATARELRGRLEPSFVTTMDRRVRRRTLHRFSIADLALLGVLASAALAMAKRRARLDAVKTALRAGAPTAIVFTIYIAIAGAVLASSYETGNAKPFLIFGALVLPLILIARAWGAAGSPKPVAKFARALACASAMIAMAFLVLERIDVAYLEGFGL